MIEGLAELTHSTWSDWMIWMFKVGEFQEDGTWIMSKEMVNRWKRQSETPYRNLPEHEKVNDIKIAKKYLDLMRKSTYCGISQIKTIEDAQKYLDWSPEK